jgi:Flp pilus assembly pilin Flp
MTIRSWFELMKLNLRRDEGQTMAEYGVVLAVITIGIVLALGALALAVGGKLNAVTSALGGVLP